MADRFIIRVRDEFNHVYLICSQKTGRRFELCYAIDQATLYKRKSDASLTLSYSKEPILRTAYLYMYPGQSYIAHGQLDRLTVEIIPVKVQVYAKGL